MSAADFEQPPSMAPEQQPELVQVRTAEELAAYADQVAVRLGLDVTLTASGQKDVRRQFALALLANPSVKPALWRVAQR